VSLGGGVFEVLGSRGWVLGSGKLGSGGLGVEGVGRMGGWGLGFGVWGLGGYMRFSWRVVCCWLGPVPGLSSSTSNWSAFRVHDSGFGI
jgi:hypothetical protein